MQILFFNDKEMSGLVVYNLASGELSQPNCLNTEHDFNTRSMHEFSFFTIPELDIS